MSLFAIKLVLTPTLLALATLAARRWGPLAAGWIVGLPLTSGPVSLFLAIEQGRAFAATSAIATLLGTIAVLAYCVTYSRASRRFSWLPSMLLGHLGFFAIAAVLSRNTFSLWPATAVTLPFIVIALYIEGDVDRKKTPIPAPWWDIPFRMAAATSIVLLITSLSSQLGPRWSGLLSAFPLFITVMSTFSHRLSGAANAQLFLHGIILGSFAYVAFFFTAVTALPYLPVVLVYLLAVCAAGAVNLAFLTLLRIRATGKPLRRR